MPTHQTMSGLKMWALGGKTIRRQIDQSSESLILLARFWNLDLSHSES